MLKELLEKHRKLQTLKNLPVLTDEYLETVEFPGGKLFVALSGEYKGNICQLRVIQQRNKRTIAVDVCYSHWYFGEEFRKLEIEIGKETIKALDSHPLERYND